MSEISGIGYIDQKTKDGSARVSVSDIEKSTKDGSSLFTQDRQVYQTLRNILSELMVLNTHMESITGLQIEGKDVH